VKLFHDVKQRESQSGSSELWVRLHLVRHINALLAGCNGAETVANFSLQLRIAHQFPELPPAKFPANRERNREFSRSRRSSQYNAKQIQRLAIIPT
jgi:hypothetical protein